MDMISERPGHMDYPFFDYRSAKEMNYLCIVHNNIELETPVRTVHHTTRVSFVSEIADYADF